MRFTGAGGFTLLEMLIALSVFALLFLISGTILSHSFASWRDSNIFMSGFQKSQLAMAELCYKLRQGKNITIIKNGDKDSIYFRSFNRNGEKKWFYYGVYDSQGVLALGVKTAQKVISEDDFGYYSPLINGVERFKVEDIRGDMSLLRIKLKLQGHKLLTSLIAIPDENN